MNMKCRENDSILQNTDFPIKKVIADFPILKQKIHGKPLVYLDSAASTQKPRIVIDAIKSFYENDYSNVHRGLHVLSERATKAYEGARDKVRDFIHAKESREIIFVRGTTEAINLVAQAYGRPRFKAGDEILITEMEHHSNIVPWQILCEQVGAILKVVPINEHGELEIDKVADLINSNTRLFAFTHISNALGTINLVKQLIELAHAKNVPVLIDGAQAAPHTNIDVQALDCDFYAFSGHKMYAPTGIGVLYAKAEILESMPPYHGGGEMITQVSFNKTTYAPIPQKFEAGTPNIVGVVGLAAAIDYLTNNGIDSIREYEQSLLNYGTDALQSIPGLRLIGTAEKKTSILSFLLDTVHAHDVGTVLDYEGIAIRSGHHCAMPVMEHFKIAATCRASLGIYNTFADIDVLVAGIYKAQEVFA